MIHKKRKLQDNLLDKWHEDLVFNKRLFEYQKRELDQRKIILKHIKKALSFSRSSTIQKEDMVKLYFYIQNEVKKTKNKDIKLERIFKNFTYNKKDFEILIKKLKMMGEIYEWKRGYIKTI